MSTFTQENCEKIQEIIGGNIRWVSVESPNIDEMYYQSENYGKTPFKYMKIIHNKWGWMAHNPPIEMAVNKYYESLERLLEVFIRLLESEYRNSKAIMEARGKA